MSTNAYTFSRAERAKRPLVVLGGIARTFGSLASFVALTFMGVGIYILADAFENPIAAQAAGLIGAAFIIALAAILLFYLFKPRRRTGTARIVHVHLKAKRSSSLVQNQPSPSGKKIATDTRSALLNPHAGSDGRRLRV